MPSLALGRLAKQSVWTWKQPARKPVYTLEQWQGIDNWRKRQQEERRQAQERERLRLQAALYDHYEKVRRGALKKLNPTADPNAPSQVFRQRAQELQAEKQNEMARTTFGQGPGVGVGGRMAGERTYTPQSSEAKDDPVIQYNKLVRMWGKEKVGQRMSDVKALWDIYGHGYDGSEVIWELTKSQFTLPEIDNMLKEAKFILDPSSDSRSLMRRDELIKEKEVLLRDKYGMTGQQYGTLERVFEAQQKAEIPTGWSQDKLGTILMMSLFLPIPNLGWLGNFSKVTSRIVETTRAAERATEFAKTTEATAQALKTVESVTTATKAAEYAREAIQVAKQTAAEAGFGSKLAAKVIRGTRFGGKFQAAMTGIAALDEMNEADRLSAIANKQAAAQEAIEFQKSGLGAALPWLAEQEIPRPLQEIRDIKQALADINVPENREDIKVIEQEMKELVGGEWEIDGLLSLDEQAAVVDMAAEATRIVYDEQRLAIEEGDADYWAEINGDMEDPYWQVAFARREERIAASDKLKYENYDKWMWYERSGIPRNKLEAKALGRKIKENGGLQAIYGSLLKTALTIGQTVDATASAINLQIRQAKDPEYQRRLNELNAYIDSLDFTPDDNWVVKPFQSHEGFARTQIEGPDSPLYNDPEAQRLMMALNERQAQLINEDYDADFLESIGLTFGSSSASMRQFELEHPDIVRAFNTGVYIATAKANPLGRLYRATFKPSVSAKAGVFAEHWRSNRAVNRIASYLHAGDGGRAANFMKGSGAEAVLQAVYHLVGKNQRLSQRSAIVRDTAKEIVGAVNAGHPERVAAILKESPDAFVDAVVQTASRATKHAPGTTKDIQTQFARVAGQLAKRQTEMKDVWSQSTIKDVLLDKLGTEYSKGADIFPWLRDSRLSAPHQLFEVIAKQVSNIPNNWLRMFLTKTMVDWYKRAPTGEIELQGANTLSRISDAVYVATHDANYAWQFRNRWAGATSNYQRLKLWEEFSKRAQNTYVFDSPEIMGQKLGLGQRLGRAFGKEDEIGGQALAPDPLGLAKGDTPPPTVAGEPAPINWANVKEGNVNMQTAWHSGSRIHQAAPDTSFARYKVSLHRSMLWAPYKLKTVEDLSAFGQNLEGAAQVIYRGLANVLIVAKNVLIRGPIGTAHRISTPLRQWTVAMGAPLLFQKHALADTARTYIETGTGSLLQSMGLRGLTVKGRTIIPQIRSYHQRELERIYSELSSAERDNVIYVKQRSHSSEAQWLSGTNREVYLPKTIRDKNGRLHNLDESAEALRRIVEGRIFQEYARGGYEAVEAWLNSKDGRTFLFEEGWTRRAREIAKESGAPITAKEAHARATAEFLDAMVEKEWTRLDSALPNIMPALKEMARNDRVLDVNEIKRLIQENPNDNAVLSLPAHTWGDNGMAGYIVGKAMSANKWNRDVVFDHIYIKTYNKMVKEGIAPDNASRVATTIAEMNTARIHFDLSYALAIEARHRWLAWFATKHRLYGTYMAKLAIERPTAAAAVVEIAHWMEERNKRKGVGEFDKYDLVVDRADGSQWRFNLPPYMWFSEFPLESSFATAMEHVASWAGEKLTGYETPSPWLPFPSPTPFGYSATRADAFIFTFYDTVVSAAAVQSVGDLMEKDPRLSIEDATKKSEESLSAWLNSLPENKRLRWRKLINNTRALSIARGENWTALQAFNEVRYQALRDMGMMTFKFYSGSVKSAEAVGMEKKLRDWTELAAVDEEAAREQLRNDPALAAALNASMDPVEKEQLDEGFRLYNAGMADIKRRIESDADMGILINTYSERADEIKALIDSLTNPMYTQENGQYNPTFARYFGENNPEEFLESLRVLMPYLPPENIWDKGRAKTEMEKEQKKEELNADFLEVLAQYGLRPATRTPGGAQTPGDSSSLLYQMLQDEYVNIPYYQWAGETEYQLVPYRAANMAEFLAKGGQAGPLKADEFLSLVEERTFRTWMGKGLGSTAKPVEPFMAYLTDEQVRMLDWVRAPGVRDAWFEYAKAEWELKLWAKEQRRTDDPETAVNEAGWGISTSSTLYKNEKAKRIGPNSVLIRKLMAVPGFREEYNFSQLKLHERLIAMGVGTGEGAEQQGMSKFLALCTDYWNELDSIVTKADNPKTPEDETTRGVGPTAQRAAKVWDKYIEKVLKLAYPVVDPNTKKRDMTKPSEWWTFFRGTYSLSKFGFVTTWSKDREDRKDIEQLYLGTEEMPEIGFEEEAWYE